MQRSSLTFSLCLTSVLLASCGEAKVAAKIKPEEFELGGTLLGRSVKACAEDGWHACLFLKRMFVPEAAEIGGKVPKTARQFENACDKNPGLRKDWSLADRACSYRPYSGLQSLGR
jgi:hypothetical protein